LNDGKATITVTGPVDVRVFAPDHVVAELFGVDDARSVQLVAAPTLRIHVDWPIAIRDGLRPRVRVEPQPGGERLAARLRYPGGAQSAANALSVEAPIGAGGIAELRPVMPGEHRVYLTFGATARYQFREVTPSTLTIDPAAGPSELRLGMSASDLRRRLDDIGR
jgi:hypothetical protein